eukprot:GSMAST32.ASY1.ANO1.2762.1 assembled CDS
MQVKMNKISIDYQVLYNAFFKFQKKPKLLGHNNCYYEGKEFEVLGTTRKPGNLSPALKLALGMPANGTSPPPWLINMQRYGPPPAYTKLKIPGLNSPIPPGASLYGNVFGRSGFDDDEKNISKSRWGEILDDDDDDDEEEDNVEEAFATQIPSTGTDTSDGISSVMTGIETPMSGFDGTVFYVYYKNLYQKFVPNEKKKKKKKKKKINSNKINSNKIVDYEKIFLHNTYICQFAKENYV